MARLDQFPCERHAEELRLLRVRLSEEVRCAHSEHTTNKIEIAKLEAAEEARKEMLERQRVQMETAMKHSELRWKRVAIILAAVTPIAGGLLTLFLKGCM